MKAAKLLKLYEAGRRDFRGENLRVQTFKGKVLSGDVRDAWIKSTAVALAAMGGTSFRGATLTDADFSQAQLKSTDFRHAVLLQTCWRGANKLDQVRSGKTYLRDSKIRQLVLTGERQGQYEA